MYAARRNTLALACSLALAAPTSRAADFAQTVYFGDSLSDAGTFGARFTTNPGPVWSEVLAERLGTQAAPAAAGGTNFAVGGARVTSLPGIPPAPPTDAAPPLTTQITGHLAATGGIASPNALYSVWGGANDIFFATGLGAGAPAYVVQTAGELSAQVARLQAAGARTIVVPNAPDIGSTPFGVSQGPAGAAALTQLSAAFNQALYADLAARGLRVAAADTFTLLNEVLADPGAYGFVNASVPACGATPSLLCTPADLVTPGADQTFVFADGVHPTTGAHALIADYVAGILAAPGQISMLAETAVATRRQHVDRLHALLQANAPARQRTERHLWVSADGQFVEVESEGIAASADGAGAGITIGADMPLGERWIVGAALSVGQPKVDWARGGHYRQTETAVSLYGSWSAGASFVTGVLSYGALDYDVQRAVHLGAATRTASGETDGTNASFGLEAGLRLTAGKLSHGPLAGVLVQQVKIEGFAEQGAGSANMRYGGQTRDSALARLGWWVQYDAGAWQPYARLTADRELRDDAREASAQLASATELPLFTMPAAAPGRTSATVVAGAALQLSPAWSANFGVSHSAAQGRGTSSGAFAMLSAAF